MVNQTDREQVAELKRVWSNYGWPVLMAIFIVLAVGFGWNWYQLRKSNQQQEQVTAFNSIKGSFEMLEFDRQVALQLQSGVTAANKKLSDAKKNQDSAAVIDKIKSDINVKNKNLTAQKKTYEGSQNDFLANTKNYMANSKDLMHVDFTHWLLAKYYLASTIDQVAASTKDKTANYQLALKQLAAVYNSKKSAPGIRQISRLRASRIMVELKQYDKALALLNQKEDNSTSFKQVTSAYINHVKELKKG